MRPLLLLHGALGSGAQFDALRALPDPKFTFYGPDLGGHGLSSTDPDHFSINQFAAEVLAYMDEAGLEQADIFGYSMGGYIGLYLAKNYPGRVGKLATLATKLSWDEEIAAREAAMLDPEKIAIKVPQLADALTARHQGKDWKSIVGKTAAMLQEMGRNPPLNEQDFATINTPLLLMLGDRDKMVSIEETLTVYKQVPGAQLSILPGAPHPYEQVDPAQLMEQLNRFFID